MPTWYMDADGDGFGRPADADRDGEEDDANGDGYTRQHASEPAFSRSCIRTMISTVTIPERMSIPMPQSFVSMETAMEMVNGQIDGIADEAGADDASIWYADGDRMVWNRSHTPRL